MLDIALETGHVTKPSVGWFARVNTETGEIGDKVRMKDTDTKEFWMPILMDKSFQDAVKQKYQVAHGAILKDEDIDAELALIEDDDATQD